MKLIDILVQELPKRGGWPEGAKTVAQDSCGEVYGFNCGAPKINNGLWWTSASGTDLISSSKAQLDLLADDWKLTFITREQYEAALAAKNDGWIEWGGGKHPPVSTNTVVDVKLEKGYVQSGYPAGEYSWEHNWQGSNIITYRLHKPDLNSRAKDDILEQDLNECIGQAPLTAWSGDWLPPVGCVCERSLAGDEWQPCKILFTSNQIVVVKMKVSGIEDAYNIGDVTFRPIRSKENEKRDDKASAIDGFISGFRGQKTGSNKELAYALTDYLALIDKL